MAGECVLRCTKPARSLTLPWWPTDLAQVMGGWQFAEQERPGDTPLSLPASRTAAEVTMGFTLRQPEYRASIAGLLADLEALSRSKTPSTLMMGAASWGLFRLDPPQVTVVEWADDGTDAPSVVDVSLVLRRASDATINTGPVKRKKKRKKRN